MHVRFLRLGGSGKERNLVYDEKNGKKYAGTVVQGKKTAINSKFIRYMTPVEWGKLQGFIDYAFVDENGVDPIFFLGKNFQIKQKYKQFGNSVSVTGNQRDGSFCKKLF